MTGTVASPVTGAAAPSKVGSVMQHDSDRMSQLPVAACDCHVHVFDSQRFPFHPGRSYTPARASLEELIAFEKRLGIQRVLLVQPSPYGSDNAARNPPSSCSYNMVGYARNKHLRINPPFTGALTHPTAFTLEQGKCICNLLRR
jgi:hypothetical protein